MFKRKTRLEIIDENAMFQRKTRILENKNSLRLIMKAVTSKDDMINKKLKYLLYLEKDINT